MRFSFPFFPSLCQIFYERSITRNKVRHSKIELLLSRNIYTSQKDDNLSLFHDLRSFMSQFPSRLFLTVTKKVLLVFRGKITS